MAQRVKHRPAFIVSIPKRGKSQNAGHALAFDRRAISAGMMIWELPHSEPMRPLLVWLRSATKEPTA